MWQCVESKCGSDREILDMGVGGTFRLYMVMVKACLACLRFG